MARGSASTSSFLAFALILLLTPGKMLNPVQAQKTWCVAKPSASKATLWEDLNYACSQVDCSTLKEGGPCFKPNNLIAHASISMNLYYQSNGRNPWNCDFKNSGLIVTTDPSSGSCIYYYKE